MSLSIRQALDIVSEIKQRDLLIGRDMSRWWMYENHIKTAAHIAKTIALRTKNIDPEQAYVCALLHDICRTNERQEQRFHGISGYEKLFNQDEKAARAALLHMFVNNELPSFEECSEMFFQKKKDYDFIADYIKNTKPTDEDLLIQLADNLSNKDGFVTIEQRANDLSIRRGFNLKPEWFEKRYKIKQYFDHKIGSDIYHLFLQQPIKQREL